MLKKHDSLSTEKRREMMKVVEALEETVRQKKKEIEEKREEIEKLEEELEGLPSRACVVDVWIHGSKDTMYGQGKDAGLSDRQLERFVYACYDVRVSLAVSEDGETEIIGADGRQLVKREGGEKRKKCK